jgi:RNA polymerase sigma-70 factor (family 1)
LTKEAFKTLFDENFDSVRNYIFYRSGDAELATDIAQDVFMKVWEKQFELSKSIKGLLYKIAHDLFINQYRKQQTIIKFNRTYEENNEENSPENEYEFNELKSKYEKALSVLPEKQRVVFLMSRKDGFTYNEIAENLNISVKAVEKRMSNALAYLRKTLNN